MSVRVCAARGLGERWSGFSDQ